MALQKTVVLTGAAQISISGAILERESFVEDLGSCYIKIEKITGGKSKIEIVVSVTNNQNAKLMRDYLFVPSVADGSKNFIAQAYEHLKTLPEFAGAVDC